MSCVNIPRVTLCLVLSNECAVTYISMCYVRQAVWPITVGATIGILRYGLINRVFEFCRCTCQSIVLYFIVNLRGCNPHTVKFKLL